LWALAPGIQPEVWFADRSGTYHYIASSFTEYLKLMASHLGIPGWQYAFTPLGLGKCDGVAVIAAVATSHHYRHRQLRRWECRAFLPQRW